MAYVVEVLLYDPPTSETLYLLHPVTFESFSVRLRAQTITDHRLRKALGLKYEKPCTE